MNNEEKAIYVDTILARLLLPDSLIQLKTLPTREREQRAEQRCVVARPFLNVLDRCVLVGKKVLGMLLYGSRGTKERAGRCQVETRWNGCDTWS